jgi:hypothetical protein
MDAPRVIHPLLAVEDPAPIRHSMAQLISTINRKKINVKKKKKQKKDNFQIPFDKKGSSFTAVSLSAPWPSETIFLVTHFLGGLSLFHRASLTHLIEG